MLAILRAVAAVRLLAPQVPDGYGVHARFPLFADSDGAVGALEVLEDGRIRPDVRKEVWGGGYADIGFCYSPDSPAMRTFCASLQGRPLRHAVIRLLDGDGKELDRRTFERELANVSAAQLYGTAQHTFFVTVDYSTGASTYSGQQTVPVEVHSGRLDWLKAIDDSTHTSDDFTLWATVKSAWMIAPARAGSGRDVLSLSCSPRQTSSRDLTLVFENHLVRYHFNAGIWHRSERVWRHGLPDWPIDCWEGEGTFPPRDSFP